MSKWLTVCIFVLLAIACTVDVEPAESVSVVRPAAQALPLSLAPEQRIETEIFREALG